MSPIQLASPGFFICHREPPQQPIATLADDAREGLLTRPRSLPPKYFYDAHGSALFDAICDTDEYYVTRVESALLEKCASEIIAHVHPGRILELGAGTARKTGHLLHACENTDLAPVYSPCDVCEAVLHQSATSMLETFPWLAIEAYASDYLAGLPSIHDSNPVLYAFLGSSIGNYSNTDAAELLREINRHMNGRDRLLLGFDRVKSHKTLTAAYNDAAGITAEFNLNVLRVLNRELGANFDERFFEHHARYNDTHCQIEMYLRSLRHQTVYISALNTGISLEKGEEILTEISRKYTLASIEAIYTEAGMTLDGAFHAPSDAFSLLLLAPT